MPGDYVKVGQTDELTPGEMKLVMVGEDRILLLNVEGEFHAVSETCTHAGGPLSQGEFSGSQVECPLHGGVFNVTTGESLFPDDPLTVYPVRVDGMDILIGLPDQSA